MTTKKDQSNTKDEEIDLGKLFELIGRGFSKLFNFIANIFKLLFNFLLTILLFVRKYAIILVISLVVGGAIGYFAEGGKKTYTSSMIVKPNFNSTRQLYKNIQYFDDLVNQKDTLQLSKIFSISPRQAYLLNSFEIKPVITNRYNLAAYNNFIQNSDSLVVKQMDYKEFIKMRTNFDYVNHKITVEALKSNLFYKLKEGIIKSLQNNDYLVSLQDTKSTNIQTEEQLTNKSLIQIDSLRKIYNKALLEEAKKPFSGTNIEMAGKDKSNKELELFKVMNEYKQQLVAINNDKTEHKKIINIISNFSNVGSKESIIRRKPGEYAITLFGLTFIILLLPVVNRYLKDYENKK